MYVLFGYLRRTNILIVLWGQEVNLLTEEQKGQKFYINVITRIIWIFEVNGQRTTDNGPHPDGSLLSVVYSLLSVVYSLLTFINQRDYTD